MKKKRKKSKKCRHDFAGSCRSGIYCVGFIGALIYYLSTATGFWVGVLGVLKALVWPAFVVFHLMKYLGM